MMARFPSAMPARTPTARPRARVSTAAHPPPALGRPPRMRAQMAIAEAQVGAAAERPLLLRAWAISGTKMGVTAIAQHVCGAWHARLEAGPGTRG